MGNHTWAVDTPIRKSVIDITIVNDLNDTGHSGSVKWSVSKFQHIIEISHTTAEVSTPHDTSITCHLSFRSKR